MISSSFLNRLSIKSNAFAGRIRGPIANGPR